jgi:hypothetical protein
VPVTEDVAAAAAVMAADEVVEGAFASRVVTNCGLGIRLEKEDCASASCVNIVFSDSCDRIPSSASSSEGQ